MIEPIAWAAEVIDDDGRIVTVLLGSRAEADAARERFELRAEIERLREMYRVSDAENDEMRAEIERLRAPPTEAEVEAAAEAIFHTEYDRNRYQWPPRGIGRYDVANVYRKAARTALEAAAKVREGK